MFVKKEESRNLQTIVLKADETKCFSETENLHSRCRKGSYRDISLYAITFSNTVSQYITEISNLIRYRENIGNVKCNKN